MWPQFPGYSCPAPHIVFQSLAGILMWPLDEPNVNTVVLRLFQSLAGNSDVATIRYECLSHPKESFQSLAGILMWPQMKAHPLESFVLAFNPLQGILMWPLYMQASLRHDF